ncbi:hypothetical protein, partial [Corynebacterium timonense]
MKGSLKLNFSWLALCGCCLFLSSCTATEPPPIAEIAEDAPTWQWVGLSTPVSGSLVSTNRNVVFAASDESVKPVFKTAPVYYPSLQRLQDGYIVPDRDRIVFLDGSLQEKTSQRIPGLGFPTMATATGASNGEAAAWTFNVGNESQPYRRLIVSIVGESINTSVRDNVPSSVRSCDDGSVVWFEQNDSVGRTLTVARMGAEGEVVENAVPLLQKGVVSEPFTALGCGDEKSYIAVANEQEGIDIFRLGNEEPPRSLDYVGSMSGLPSPGINRSTQVTEGKVRQFSQQGTISTVDLSQQSI